GLQRKWYVQLKLLSYI
ncbi:hypothetical protein M513_00795, partial [Trichuris suis]